MNVKMNREGYANIEDVLTQGQQALSPEAFEAAVNETSALVLDTRKPEDLRKRIYPERHQHRP
jgi:hydroxyacylglutathione hydrolase